ncbi:MAG: hypothetical protein WCO13_15030 [Bacteroidota bacterium]
MGNLYEHGFSDETPIQDIAKSFFGIDINGIKLKELLSELASKQDERYHNLSPTTAFFGAFILQTKCSYIINRIIDLYTTDIELKNKIHTSYDKYVTAIKEKRRAERNLNDNASIVDYKKITKG